MDQLIETAFDWFGPMFITTVLAIMCADPSLANGIKIFMIFNCTFLVLAATPD